MTQQGETQQPQQVRRRLGGGAIASLTGLAVLLIFIIQNRVRIQIDFYSGALSGRYGSTRL